jgi:hypothetical protein
VAAIPIHVRAFVAPPHACRRSATNMPVLLHRNAPASSSIPHCIRTHNSSPPIPSPTGWLHSRMHTAHSKLLPFLPLLHACEGPATLWRTERTTVMVLFVSRASCSKSHMTSGASLMLFPVPHDPCLQNLEAASVRVRGTCARAAPRIPKTETTECKTS